jgi:hypothetical protein
MIFSNLLSILENQLKLQINKAEQILLSSDSRGELFCILGMLNRKWYLLHSCFLSGSCTAIKIKEAFRQLNEKFFEKNNAEKVKIMIGDSCSTQIAGLKRCNLVFPECNTNDMCIPSH